MGTPGKKGTLGSMGKKGKNGRDRHYLVQSFWSALALSFAKTPFLARRAL